MSRRFGRNQRRRAREALADQVKRTDDMVKAAAMTAGLLKNQRSQIDEAEAFVREIAEMVGRQAIIAGQPILLKGEGFDRMRLPILENAPSVPVFGSTMRIDPIRCEVLRLLSVEAVASDFRQQIHCYAELDDKKTGYMISATALRKMTAGEIERRIAPEIARHLAQQLKAFR